MRDSIMTELLSLDEHIGFVEMSESKLSDMSRDIAEMRIAPESILDAIAIVNDIEAELVALTPLVEDFITNGVGGGRKSNMDTKIGEVVDLFVSWFERIQMAKYNTYVDSLVPPEPV